MVAFLVTLVFGLGQLAAGPGEVTRTCKIVTPPGQHSHATHCRTVRGPYHFHFHPGLRHGSTPHRARWAAHPCPRRELRVTAGGSPGLTAGGDAIVVSVRHVRGPACHIDAVVRVSLLGPGGTPLEGVHGNPFARTINRRLRSGRKLEAALEWANWCGSAKRAVIAGRVDGFRARGSLDDPPSCLDRRHSSTLKPANGRGHWLLRGG